MGSVSLSGTDVIQINGRILTDLGEGNPVEVTFPNDQAVMKVGKNGNVIYAFNASGQVVEAKIRILLGTADDQFLNSLLQTMINDFSGFILMTGQFSKRVGDGQGTFNTKVYQMGGGIFKKTPDAKTAAEGDTDQSIAEYHLMFNNAGTSIQ
jgi:hypothetical protein